MRTVSPKEMLDEFSRPSTPSQQTVDCLGGGIVRVAGKYLCKWIKEK